LTSSTRASCKRARSANAQVDELLTTENGLRFKDCKCELL